MHEHQEKETKMEKVHFGYFLGITGVELKKRIKKKKGGGGESKKGRSPEIEAIRACIPM